MKVYVIDAQGGGVGRSLTEKIREALPEIEVIVIGSNAMATAAMLKGGAKSGATGENAILYCCSHASEKDIIIGPVGIVLADAMLGEITPAMACAVSQSRAYKILVPAPASRSHAAIAGVAQKSLSQYLDDAVEILCSMVS